MALPLDVTDRASFDALPRRGRAPARPGRRGDQQRRDHAGDAVRRGERRTRSAASSTSTSTASSPAPSWRSSGCAPAAAATSSTSPRRRARPALPGIATYSATKHAVVGLCEAVRAELRGSGVEVLCVMPTVVNTELTSGVGQRWVKPVEAADVANEIVDALEVPRFDVFVPRANGVLYRIAGAAAARSCARRSGRLMKVDKLMTEVDHGARHAYEERAAASEPGSRRRGRATPQPDAPAAARRRRRAETRPPDGADLRRDLGPGLLGHLRPLLEGDRGGGAAGDARETCWRRRGGGRSRWARGPGSTSSSIPTRSRT